MQKHTRQPAAIIFLGWNEIATYIESVAKF